MNINQFKYEGGNWIYEEVFIYYGVKCEFRLIIHSEDIFSMYEVNSKSMKIKGSRTSFCIFIRFPKQKMPIHAHERIGCAEYYLCCIGDKLVYDNGVGINNTRKNKLVCDIHEGTRVSVGIPNSVVWSATHPFQGGGLTPK